MWKRFLLAAALVCGCAGAQVPVGFISVTQSRLVDGNGVSVGSATVCAQAVSGTQALSLGLGGGGTTTTPPVCVQATNGVWSMNLPDGAQSSPLNATFAITGTDNVSGAKLLAGYMKVQPHSQTCTVVAGAVSCVANVSTDWCQAGGCNFDQLKPSAPPASLIVTGQEGRIGPQGIPGVTGPPGSITAANFLTGLGVQGKGVGQPLIASYGNGYMSSSAIWNFGDSICHGVGASDFDGGYDDNGAPNKGFAWQVDWNYSNVTNDCHSGDSASDMVRNRVYRHYSAPTTGAPVITVAIGVNDANSCGASEGCQGNYYHELMAALVHSATPPAGKVLGQSPGWSETGTWGNDNDVVPGVFRSTTQVGASKTATLSTTGGPVYVTWRAFSSGGGSANITIDGNAVGSIGAFGYVGQNVSGQVGLSDTVFAERYPVAAGAHTVTITSTSANLFSIGEIATTVPSLSVSPPRAFVSGVIRQYQGAKDATTALFDTQAKNLVTTLQSDGMYLSFVDVRSRVNVTTDYAGGTLPDGTVCIASGDIQLHPGQCGHDHMRDAFLASIQPVMTLPTRPAAPTNLSQYQNVNPLNLQSQTGLNPGLTVYSKGNNIFGMDLGSGSRGKLGGIAEGGDYYLRLFAPHNAAVSDAGNFKIGFCFFESTGLVPSLQSSAYCPVRIYYGGIIAPLIIGGLSAPADISQYNGVNGGGFNSSTGLNAGINLYHKDSYFGVDLGHGSGGFQTRSYAPTGSAISSCFYPAGTVPSAQGDFDCKSVLTPAGQTFSVPMSATGYSVGSTAGWSGTCTPPKAPVVTNGIVTACQ